MRSVCVKQKLFFFEMGGKIFNRNYLKDGLHLQ